jgi:hypothetical protein
MAYRFKARSVVPGASALKHAAINVVAGYPAEADVKLAVDYGTSGTEYTGTYAPGGACDYPSEDDVRDGVTFDSGGQTGNMTVPAESDVRLGVTYGTLGVEYTGTYGVATGSGTDPTIQKLMAGLYQSLHLDAGVGGVSTLTGDRIHEIQAPQNEELPLLVFSLAVQEPLEMFAADTLRAEVQVDIYTSTDDGIATGRAIAERVVAIWNRQAVTCTDWNRVTLLKLDNGLASTEEDANRLILRFRLFAS